MDSFGLTFSQAHSSDNAIQFVSKLQESTFSKSKQALVAEELALPVSDNVLSSLFVDQFREQSKYINGIMAGFEIQNSFKNKMQAAVAGYNYIKDLSSMVGEELSYAERNLLGKEAAEAVKTAMDEKVEQEVGEQVKANADEIEDKANEAVAPESEKALENETSSQEALEKSLEEKSKGDNPRDGEPEAGKEGAEAETEETLISEGGKATEEDRAMQNASKDDFKTTAGLDKPNGDGGKLETEVDRTTPALNLLV